MARENRIEQLETRVSKLEGEIEALRSEQRLIIPQSSEQALKDYYEYPPEASLKEVVLSIIEALGLELDYQKARPAHTIVRKQKKRAGT